MALAVKARPLMSQLPHYAPALHANRTIIGVSSPSHKQWENRSSLTAFTLHNSAVGKSLCRSRCLPLFVTLCARKESTWLKQVNLTTSCQRLGRTT